MSVHLQVVYSIPVLKNSQENCLGLKIINTAILALREKYSYSELFWSVFSRIWTEYAEILRVPLYSVRMLENTNQNNSEYGHFLRSVEDNSKWMV